MDWTWMNDLGGVLNGFVRPWFVFATALGIPLTLFLILAAASERAQLAEEDAADAAEG